MKRNVINVVLGIFIAMAFGLAGCGGGGSSSSPPANSQATLSSNTIKISDDTSSKIAVFSNYSSSVPGQQQITFTGTTSQLETMKTGSPILLGITPSTPNGFMGKVSSVAKDTNGNTVVTTEPAALNEVFETLKVNYTKTISAGDIVSVDSIYKKSSVKNTMKNALAAVSGTGEYTETYDLSTDGITHTLDVTLNSDINVSIDIGFFKVNKFNVVATPYYKIVDTVGVTAEVPFLGINKEIARYRIAPIPVATGVWITPIITLRLNANGKIEGVATISQTKEVKYSAGLTYENEAWSNKLDKIIDNHTFDKNIGVSAVVEADVIPQLDLLFNSVAGPYFNFALKGKVTVDPCLDPWLKAEAGVDFNYGARIRLINKEVNYDVALLPFSVVDQVTGPIPYTGVVTGLVTDSLTNKYLSGTEILLTSATGNISKSYTTGSNGVYSIALPACTFDAKFAKARYMDNTIKISDVKVNKTASHDVSLQAGDFIIQSSGTISKVNDTAQLTAVYLDSSGSQHNIPNADLTWSSSNASVATIDALGVAKGVGSGTVTITATENTSGKNATISIAIGVSIDHIKLTADKTSVSTGSSANLTATAYADSAETIIVPSVATDYTWSVTSGSGSVANGVFTARSTLGLATVQAMYIKDPTKENRIDINVKNILEGAWSGPISKACIGGSLLSVSSATFQFTLSPDYRCSSSQLIYYGETTSTTNTWNSGPWCLEYSENTFGTLGWITGSVNGDTMTWNVEIPNCSITYTLTRVQ